jgi:DNA-directed RNA polymerase subunit RPC12/RpoP
MRSRYGVDYAQQNAGIKKKQLATMLERYRSESPLRSDRIREKAAASNMKNTYMKFLNGEAVPAFSFEEYLERRNDREYTWRCLKCGKEFASSVNMSWFKQGPNRSYARCKKCYPCRPHSSREETELREFVESEYRGKIARNTRERTPCWQRR